MLYKARTWLDAVLPSSWTLMSIELVLVRLRKCVEWSSTIKRAGNPLITATGLFHSQRKLPYHLSRISSTREHHCAAAHVFSKWHEIY